MSGSAVTIDIIYCNSGILIFVGGAFLNLYCQVYCLMVPPTKIKN